jgi:hypothetical protein
VLLLEPAELPARRLELPLCQLAFLVGRLELRRQIAGASSAAIVPEKPEPEADRQPGRQQRGGHDRCAEIHDLLPIPDEARRDDAPGAKRAPRHPRAQGPIRRAGRPDRKSTRGLVRCRSRR